LAEGTDRTELIARATKAIVADRGASGFGRSTSSKGGDYAFNPDTDLKRVLEMVQKDPVVRGAITTLVDRTIEPGFSFYGKDKKSRQQSAVDKMEELRFTRLLRPMLQHLFTYNNAFIEIVKGGEEPKELHMIDPRYLEPQGDDHGEIVRYVQQSAQGGVVTWTAEEVVHLKTTPLSNSVWGDIDMRALWTACALKYHIKKLYLWQYETNQFRPLLNIKDATNEQITRFLTFLDQARSDIKKLVPIEGEVESIHLEMMQDYSKVKELLTYLDYEILNILQVPPIAVGLPDNSNRSNSDAQERALNTRIRSIHLLLEDLISHDLLPKLGFEKVTLKFNTVDDKSMDTYLQMAERMKNMGFKTELIKDFLEAKGFDFPEGEIFDEELLALAKQPKQEAGMPGTKKSQDMQPSRAGKMPGQANEKIGSGERSTTRKEQLLSREEPAWRKYGTIEVEE
jgi:hypothetical protein